MGLGREREAEGCCEERTFGWEEGPAFDFLAKADFFDLLLQLLAFDGRAALAFGGIAAAARARQV